MSRSVSTERPVRESLPETARQAARTVGSGSEESRGADVHPARESVDVDPARERRRLARPTLAGDPRRKGRGAASVERSRRRASGVKANRGAWLAPFGETGRVGRPQP
ncbi:hypothetical protein GCM10012289_56730 [Nonomuraea cavernae]|uniref:Uncharacterized protein n=1 Tax=Nonomuraea cavernae TaxID=2045107 RepID=A0A917Z7L8_9ACTN|nr:hypothetical protein GCM10012289_56730 [Nonomuraea cavernae]